MQNWHLYDKIRVLITSINLTSWSSTRLWYFFIHTWLSTFWWAMPWVVILYMFMCPYSFQHLTRVASLHGMKISAKYVYPIFVIQTYHEIAATSCSQLHPIPSQKYRQSRSDTRPAQQKIESYHQCQLCTRRGHEGGMEVHHISLTLLPALLTSPTWRWEDTYAKHGIGHATGQSRSSKLG